VEERERRALASELHDYLAQLLTLGHIKLQLAQQSLDSSPRQTERYMRETAEALQHSIKYARTLMAELVPPELHQSGLADAIRWLADNMANKHGLTVDLRLEPLNLAQHQAVFLYRCVQELLINVVKHAGVDRAIVALTVDADRRLVLTVEDRGRGYNPESVKASSGDGHFGLPSIRQRLDSIGGWFTEDSAIGKGTTSTLGLYLSEPALQSSSHAARSPASRDRVEQTSTEPSAQERLPLE
jgi:signal transduction histidine kinase